MSTAARLCRPCGWLFSLLALVLFTSTTRADDTTITLRVQLVWGTNDPKPDKDKLKEIDPKLVEKLGEFFKWKNYFEVEGRNVTLAKNGEQKLKLSEKCEVLVRDKGDGNIALELIGEGQSFKKLQQPISELKNGHRWAIGGKDTQKWGDAWFVVISMPPAKK